MLHTYFVWVSDRQTDIPIYIYIYNRKNIYLILVHTVQLKQTILAKISGRMSYIGISDVVTTSVYTEETRLKKLMKIIIIIMNKSQETTVFHGCQKWTSAMKLRLEK